SRAPASGHQMAQTPGGHSGFRTCPGRAARRAVAGAQAWRQAALCHLLGVPCGEQGASERLSRASRRCRSARAARYARRSNRPGSRERRFLLRPPGKARAMTRSLRRLLSVLVLFAAGAAHADPIEVLGVGMEPVDEGYVVHADFWFELSSKLEEAL